MKCPIVVAFTSGDNDRPNASHDQYSDFIVFFKRIGNKIILVYGGITIAALLTLIWFYAQQQERSILEQNELTMGKLARSVTSGLHAIMLAGYADVAKDYASRLQQVPDILDFKIVRANGLEAFLDNTTIEKVNARIGDEEFFPRDDEDKRQIFEHDDPVLEQAFATQDMVPIYTTGDDGVGQLVFVAPIMPTKQCSRCHGIDERARGYVKLTTSLDSVERAIEKSQRNALIVSVLMLAGILFVTTLFVIRTVVRPIRSVTDAMVHAAKGNLDQAVPILGQDEISSMASSFNAMTSELKTTYVGLESEQDKLNTIILSAREGIVVTNSQGEVVLTNPSVQEFLGKTGSQIASEGFLHIFDDDEAMLGYLNDDSDDPIELEYNDRILSVKVARIYSDDGHLSGSSALIRDITEEKRFEQQLIRISTTDGLTDLYNRRFLNKTLESELARARRYGHPLSVLMFDVDHFKKFNDTHGHDQGDRVLQSIGQTMRDVVRAVDFPCRYGGEEFLIILPDTGHDGSLVLGERLRQQVESTLVDGLQVTISIGIATFPLADFTTYEAMIESADGALYEAKDGGRNCVRHAQRELLLEP
ncbi:sensor domain-containing diguanylate cyclase [Motiliproteus sediminis]|uniref:sensor domain-containing diguanylate cyclase n=1 Tax=Motiliproteus sediminis TaxID=1468178 RepID=UPI001AEFD347